MQDLEVYWWRIGAAAKDISRSIYQLALPFGDLVGVHVVLLSYLSEGFIPSELLSI